MESKKEFNYDNKLWGIKPITNLVTDFHGLILKFLLTDLPQDYQSKKIKVLDVGCGGGNVDGYLKHKFKKWQITGVDVAGPALILAQKRFKQVTFVESRAEKLPFKDKSFALVISFEVLEHLEQLDGALKEVGRVLKPGGVFYASVPLEKQWPTVYWLTSKMGWRGKEKFAGHVNVFNDHELVKRVEGFGFKLVSKRFSGHLFFSLLDLVYYLTQSVRGKEAVSFETKTEEMVWGFKRILVRSLKQLVSAVSFVESSLFWWFPATRGHFMFVKGNHD